MGKGDFWIQFVEQIPTEQSKTLIKHLPKTKRTVNGLLCLTTHRS